MIRTEKSVYVREKTAKLRAKDKSSQVLTDVLEHTDTWEIEEIYDGTYSIKGYGLGYSEDLTVGEWYYYQDTKTVEAMSSASITLKDIITAKTEIHRPQTYQIRTQ